MFSFKRLSTFALLVVFWLCNAAWAQTATELNITLGEQRVKFAPTRSFQEMRLEVVNSAGEIVFVNTTSEAEFAWNLKNNSDAALAAGLYRYTLTLKFSEELTRQHTGHFIVEKGQDQIWLTANEGATVSGAELNATRSGGRSIAGVEAKDSKSAQRTVEGREVVDEKGGKLTDEKKAVKAEKAALLGTLNKVAKFGASGAADTDSTITEDATGKLGFGVTPSATTPLLFNGDINPALGAGLPAFTLQSNLDHARLEMRSASNSGHAPIVQGRASGGTLAAPTASALNQILGGFGGSGYDATNGFAVISHGFIGIRAGELWTPTAHGTYMGFETTANGSLTRIERMRITGDGNVGIRNTNPQAKLDIGGDIRSSALRQELTASSPNVINGFMGTGSSGATPGNRAIGGVQGASIGGGGFNGVVIFPPGVGLSSDYSNLVSDMFGTVGGGAANTAGDNDALRDNATFATVGGGASNIAGSYYATIGGGSNNSVGEYGGTVGGGEANTAAGKNSVIPGGKGARTSLEGEMAHASGFFTSGGDAQTSVYVLRNISTNATPTELFLDGASQRLTIGQKRAVSFDILVTAYEQVTYTNAAYHFRGLITRFTGGTSLYSGTVVKEVLGEDVASWDVNLTTDASNALQIIVNANTPTTGIRTVRWVATVRTSEVAQP